MDFQVMLCKTLRQNRQWQLTWTVWREDGKAEGMGSSRFQDTDRDFQVLLMAPEETGIYRIEWELHAGTKSIARQTELEIKDREE